MTSLIFSRYRQELFTTHGIIGEEETPVDNHLLLWKYNKSRDPYPVKRFAREESCTIDIVIGDQEDSVLATLNKDRSVKLWKTNTLLPPKPLSRSRDKFGLFDSMPVIR
jgi:hypothetical protein